PQITMTSLELISRGKPLPASITDTWTLALQKIRDESISTQQIQGLSQAERNRLTFDGNSIEALEIIEKLADSNNTIQRGFVH
ncbi:MAG: hypothetical protein NTZ86_07075, partial [Legionellales bacterium]|nr:hypothetical protein [Legionellales bacterium]